MDEREAAETSLPRPQYLQPREVPAKLHRSCGASIVEYALLIGFVATVGFLTLRALGQSMSQQFSSSSGIIGG